MTPQEADRLERDLLKQQQPVKAPKVTAPKPDPVAKFNFQQAQRDQERLYRERGVEHQRDITGRVFPVDSERNRALGVTGVAPSADGRVDDQTVAQAETTIQQLPPRTYDTPELKTAKQTEKQLQNQAQLHKLELEKFDRDNADQVEFDKTGEPVGGALVNKIGDLQKRAGAKVGLWDGLTTDLSSGDLTPDAQAATAELNQVKPDLEARIQQRKRILEEHARVKTAADEAELNRRKLEDSHYGVTPEAVDQAATQVNAARAVQGQPAVSSDVGQPAPWESDSAKAYTGEVVKPNERTRRQPEGMRRVVEGQSDGSAIVTDYPIEAVKTTPDGTSVAETAVQTKSVQQANDTGLSVDAAAALQVDKLRKAGVTQIGGVPIDQFSQSDGAVGEAQIVQTVNALKGELDQLDAATGPNSQLVDRVKRRLLDRREVVQNLYDQKVGSEAYKNVGTFWPELKRGVDNVMAGDAAIISAATKPFQAVEQGVAKALGMENYQGFYKALGESAIENVNWWNDAAGAQVSKAPQRIEDIHGAKDFARWGLGQLGQQVPVLADLVTTTLATGGTGGVLKAGAKVIPTVLKPLVEQALVKGAVPIKLLSKVAGGPAAWMAASKTEFGSIYSDILQMGRQEGDVHKYDNPVAALTFGTVAGAFKGLPISNVLKKAGLAKEAYHGIMLDLLSSPSFTKRLLASSAEQMALEGGTEWFQTWVENAAQSWVNKNKPLFTQENYDAAMNAAAAGAFIGVAAEGAPGAIHRQTPNTKGTPPAAGPAPTAPVTPPAPAAPVEAKPSGADPFSPQMDDELSAEINQPAGTVAAQAAKSESAPAAPTPTSSAPAPESVIGQNVTEPSQEAVPANPSAVATPTGEKPGVEAKGQAGESPADRSSLTQPPAATSDKPQEKPTTRAPAPAAGEFQKSKDGETPNANGVFVGDRPADFAFKSKGAEADVRTVELDNGEFISSAHYHHRTGDMRGFGSPLSVDGPRYKTKAEATRAGLNEIISANERIVASKSNETTPQQKLNAQALISQAKKALAQHSPSAVETAKAKPVVVDNSQAKAKPSSDGETIARGKNTPAEFIKQLTKAVGLKGSDAGSKFLGDFARRLHAAAPKDFEQMEVHVLTDQQWKAHVGLAAQTPDSRAAYDNQTNTLYIHAEKAAGNNVVEAFVHEAGHFAEKFALGEDFTQAQWESLTDAQREAAAKQYDGGNVDHGADLKTDRRARAEWVAMQFARVIRGDTQGMDSQLKLKLTKFLTAVRELVNKWLGDGKLTTPELDARIISVMFPESKNKNPALGKRQEPVSPPKEVAPRGKTDSAGRDAVQIKPESAPVVEKIKASGALIAAQKKLISYLTADAKKLGTTNPEKAGPIFDRIAREQQKLAQMVAEKKSGPAPSVGTLPNGEPDLLTDIAEHVGKIKTIGKGGEYDGWEVMNKGAARLLRGGESGMDPDQAIEIINENTGHKFGSVHEFQTAIESAVDTRIKFKAAFTKEEHANAVEAAAIENKGRGFATKPKAGVPIEEIGVGGKFKIRGEKFSVIDTDEGANGQILYIIKDGHRFMVPEGTMFYADRGTLEKAEPDQSSLDASNDPTHPDFQLEPPTAEAAAAEAAARKKREDAEKIAEANTARLKGDAGDQTKDMFGGGDMALFDAAEPTVAPSKTGKFNQKLKDQARDAFDGLLGTPADNKFDENIPSDRAGKFLPLAQQLVADGVNTPEKVAQFLEETFAGKARKFSQSLWNFLSFADTTLTGRQDWASVYRSIDNPPASDTVESKPVTSHEPSPDTNLERDRTGAVPQDRGGTLDVRPAGGPDVASGGAMGEPGGSERGQQGGAGDTSGVSATDREGSDTVIPERLPGAVGYESGTSGGKQPSGGGSVGGERALVESGADTAAPDAPSKQPAVDVVARSRETTLEERVKQQRATESVGIVTLDQANIRETLPVLLPEQQDDVFKAERRFFEAKGRGILFTNGTGTGKTFTGLGVIKRFVRRGAKNILIVVPSSKKAMDWQEDGHHLQLDIGILDGIKDGGKGISVTTYANFRTNDALAARDFDLVVYDESHKLMENQQGERTTGDQQHRYVTNHPGDVAMKATERIIGPRPVFDSAMNKNPNMRDAYNEALAGWNNRRDANKEKIAAEVARIKDLTKVVFLSATPFAYHKTLAYADGYLFESPSEKGSGYNVAQGFDRFLQENFGYRMRTNKLTQPEADVNMDVMERAFADRLMKEGAMSGRSIDVPYDYSREFVLLDPGIGAEIDRGIGILGGWVDKDKNNFKTLHEVIRNRFTYIYTMQLLESVKVAQALGRLRQHIALGRKVILFHDYNNANPQHPFRGLGELAKDASQMKEIQHFEASYPELVNLDMGKLMNPLRLLEQEFGAKAVFFNGTVSAGKRMKNVKAFNDDNSPVRMIVAQSDAMAEGVSAHDTTGKHQRVVANVGLPVKPTKAIQEEGRAYRVGVKSNAIYEYFVIHTSSEKYAFGSKINERVRTAENLALGSQARALQDSFKQGYLNPSNISPGENQGRGGKEGDRSANTMTEFERAKSFYFGRQKKTQQTKSAEGVDYFATPEPIGLTMAEWAKPRPNEKMLEPSAGHGAIARFFPTFTNNTYIEPSFPLAEELRIKVSSGQTEIMPFEDLNVVNKYDAIVMNPPFGSGGSTAMKHLAKAATHLRNGGRIIALIPEGPAADAKFDKWYEESAKHFIKVAEYGLPHVVFERAGANVKTRIVVIDRIDDDTARSQSVTKGRVEISGDTIGEVFDRIDGLGGPPERMLVAPEQVPAAPLSSRDSKLPVQPKIPDSVNSGIPKSGKFELAQFKHTKTGADVFVAKTGSLSNDEYRVANSIARRLGGYYSSFKGAGAVPGIHFKTEADRQKFLDEMAGSGLLGTPTDNTDESFSQAIDSVVNGTWEKTRDIVVGPTPAVLVASGADQLPVVMAPRIIPKVTQHDHSLTVETIKNIPSALRDPIFVFDSSSVPDAQVVITELKHGNKNILVAIHLNQRSARTEVNRIASIYDHTSEGSISSWMKAGLLRYAHQQKGRAWFQSRGLQLPKEGSKRGNTKLLTETDIVNPNILGSPSEPTVLTPPKNADVPGSEGYKYRSHTDTLIERGIQAARLEYKTLSDADSLAAAKAFIASAGEPAAAESVFDDALDVPAKVKTAIGALIEMKLGARRFDPALSAEDRRAAARQFDRLSERMAIRGTELGQAIQGYDLINKLSPDGVLQAANRSARSRQGKMIGPDGEKTIGEITDAMKQANEQAIDQATAELDQVMRKIRIGKSIWARYKDMASRRWLKRIQGNLQQLPENPPLAQFVNRLVAEVNKRIDAALPPGEKPPAATAIQTLAEAVNNREKYAEAWKIARDKIEEAYSDQPNVLNALDSELMGVIDKPYSQKTLDRALKDAFKQLGSSVAQLAKMHYQQADALGVSLADKLVQESGLKAEDAKNLADEIRKRIGELTAEAKKAAIAKIGQGKTGVSKRITTVTDKIIQMSNLGALEKSEVLDMIASELKLPRLTEAAAAKLRSLAEKAQKTPEGFQRDRIITDILGELHKLRGVGMIDVATAVYYAHILSGYTTQAVNAISTTMNTLADISILIAQNPKTAAQAVTGIRDGALTGFTHAMSILSTGYAHRTFDMKITEVSPLLELMSKDEAKGPRDKALKAYSTVLRYVSRSMKAADAVFFHSASEAFQRVAAANLAGAAGGMDRAELNHKIRDLLAMNPADFDAARRQAQSEGLTGLDYKLRVAEIIQQKRAPALADAATQFGREATFNNEPRGYLGVIARKVGEAAQEFPPLKLFVPFTNIVSNVTNVSLNYTPLGAVRAFTGFGREKAPMAAERNALLIKSIAGTTGMIALLALGSGDDEPPIITANGPDDPSARNQLRQTGWRPHSIRVGNVYLSYLESPAAIGAAIVGNYVDAVKYNGVDKKEVGERVLKAIAGTGETITSMSFLQGLADLMDTLRGKKSPADFAANVTTSMAIPNLVRQVDRTISPTIRQGEGIAGRIQAAIPIARQSLPQREDVLGKPIESRPMQRFGQQAKGDPLWDTIAQKQAWIPEASKQTKIGNHIMTSEEYRRYVEESGVAIERRLRASLGAIQQMPAEKANDFVDRVTREERARVKSRMRGSVSFSSLFDSN